MFEKANPKHPDKQADCIAGAIVDLAYKEKDNPKIAVEVLLGHENCHVIIETDCNLNKKEISRAIKDSFFSSSDVGTPLKMPLSPHLIFSF